MRPLLSNETFDVFYKRAVLAHSPGSVVVNEHVAALTRDAESIPDVGSIIEVPKGISAGFAKKGPHVLGVGKARHSNEVDPITKLFLCFYDRRSFTSSKWSPGRPEPEHDVLASKGVKVDGCSVEGGKFASQ